MPEGYGLRVVSRDVNTIFSPQLCATILARMAPHQLLRPDKLPPQQSRHHRLCHHPAADKRQPHFIKRIHHQVGGEQRTMNDER